MIHKVVVALSDLELNLPMLLPNSTIIRNIEVVYTADCFKDVDGASGCTDQFRKNSIQ